MLAYSTGFAKLVACAAVPVQDVDRDCELSTIDRCRTFYHARRALSLCAGCATGGQCWTI